MKNEKPVVFITQKNETFDYSCAEKFGTIKYITCEEYSPNPNSKANTDLEKDIIENIKEFDPKKDFLLLSGSPITIGLIMHRIWHFIAPVNKFKVLLRNGRSEKYMELEIRDV